MAHDFFNSESISGVVVIDPKSEMLDASNKDAFRSALESLAVGSTRLVLDLSKVRFVDSSGLGVIMTSLKKLRSSGGEMVVCSISKPVKLLFDIVRLDRVISDFPDRASAAAFLSSGPERKE